MIAASPSRKRIRSPSSSSPSSSSLHESFESFLSKPKSLAIPREWLSGDNHNCQVGSDLDSPVLFCIKKDAYEAAAVLLKAGLDPNQANPKTGMTPLILSAQRGQLELCALLLKHGASPELRTHQGSTAALQAAHFGFLDILKLILANGGFKLMELSSNHQTSPLMRAAQEGHRHICEYLLQQGALVNRKNHQQMTALMLASQRGHASVCSLLIQNGADLDAITENRSNALLLAAKRSHYETCFTLVKRGSELYTQDSRGRTPHYLAKYKSRNEKLATLLLQERQVELVQQHEREKQLCTLQKCILLYQRQRALISSNSDDMMLELLSEMPSSVIPNILQYVPLPNTWDFRLALFTKRAVVNANAATLGALDVIDEILEQGGFCQLCDDCQITPPTLKGRQPFTSWKEWKAWCRQNGKTETCPSSFLQTNATSLLENVNATATNRRVDITTISQPTITATFAAPTLWQLRRHAQYLNTLSTSQKLQDLIPLSSQLVNCSETCQLLRKIQHCKYPLLSVEPSVAMNIIVLASRLSTSMATLSL